MFDSVNGPLIHCPQCSAVGPAAKYPATREQRIADWNRREGLAVHDDLVEPTQRTAIARNKGGKSALSPLAPSNTDTRPPLDGA